MSFNKPDITLEPYEVHMAASTAVQRCVSSIKDNRSNAHGYSKGSGWSDNIEGACAELVVAKYYNIYWNGSVDTFKSADLGSKIQVRWTWSHNYSLIVRPADSEKDVYILVSGYAPNFRIQGFLYGEDAKNSMYLRNDGSGRPDGYFIPNENLIPIGQLNLDLYT
jgi:hypothetical protein